jgi:hypothetical protein
MPSAEDAQRQIAVTVTIAVACQPACSGYG